MNTRLTNILIIISILILLSLTSCFKHKQTIFNTEQIDNNPLINQTVRDSFLDFSCSLRWDGYTVKINFDSTKTYLLLDNSVSIVVNDTDYVQQNWKSSFYYNYNHNEKRLQTDTTLTAINKQPVFYIFNFANSSHKKCLFITLNIYLKMFDGEKITYLDKVYKLYPHRAYYYDD